MQVSAKYFPLAASAASAAFAQLSEQIATSTEIVGQFIEKLLTPTAPY
jgi:hypothetical protein